MDILVVIFALMGLVMIASLDSTWKYVVFSFITDTPPKAFTCRPFYKAERNRKVFY